MTETTKVEIAHLSYCPDCEYLGDHVQSGRSRRP
jgi:hypothetical protein